MTPSRTTLLEGVLLTLEGDSDRKGAAVANARALLAGERRLVMSAPAATQAEVDEVASAVREALAEGKLSAADRHSLPKSAFVYPEREAYPIHDEGHARAALARVAQHGSGDEKAKVRAAVYARYPKLKKMQEADMRADYPSMQVCADCARKGKKKCSHLREAKDSLAKASSPEPFSTSKTSNWIARNGGLPAYIQHIAHDIHDKRGKSVSQAIQIAIGVVKRWAKGGGNVDAGTKAAAAKAVAEWEKLKAKAAGKRMAKTAKSLAEAEELDAIIALEEGAEQAAEDFFALGILEEAALVERGHHLIKRLGDGTFAPAGRGVVLTRGDHPRVAPNLPRGTVVHGGGSGLTFATRTDSDGFKHVGGSSNLTARDVHHDAGHYELPSGAKVKPEALEMLPHMHPEHIPDALLNTAIRNAEEPVRASDFWGESRGEAGERLSALRHEKSRRGLGNDKEFDFSGVDFNEDDVSSEADPHGSEGSRERLMARTREITKKRGAAALKAWQARSKAPAGPAITKPTEPKVESKPEPQIGPDPHKEGRGRVMSVAGAKRAGAVAKARQDPASRTARELKVADQISAVSPHKSLRGMDRVRLAKFAKPLPEATTLHHGSHEDFLGGEPGDTVTLKQPVSFTGSESLAGAFGHHTIYHFETPKGAKTFRPADVNQMFPSEDEHVLLKNTKFKINRKEKRDGKLHVYGSVERGGGSRLSEAEVGEFIAEWLCEAALAGRISGFQLQEALGLNARDTFEVLQEAKRGTRIGGPTVAPRLTPKDAQGGGLSMHNDRAAHLQRRLTSLGFDTNPDGNFGPKTAASVKAFQAHAMLKEDGIVGPKTTAALQAAPHPDEITSADRDGNGVPDAAEAKPEAAPTGEQSPKLPSGEAQPKQVLYKGLGVGEEEAHEGVRAMQACLGEEGHDLEPDGRFGPKTERAVKSFQRKFGLRADGMVGEKTHRTMARVHDKHHRLREAVSERKAAQGGQAFTRALAREQRIRTELAEGLVLEEANKGFEAMIAALVAKGIPEEQAKAIIAKNKPAGAPRGTKAKAKIELKRMPNGKFAPKGQGQVLDGLKQGQSVHLDHGAGAVIDAHVLDVMPHGHAILSSHHGGFQTLSPDGTLSDSMHSKQQAVSHAESLAPPQDEWTGPALGSEITDKNGTVAKVTAHHDHPSGDPEKKKFTVEHEGGSQKIGYKGLGDIYAGKAELKGSKPPKADTKPATPAKKNEDGSQTPAMNADGQYVGSDEEPDLNSPEDLKNKAEADAYDAELDDESMPNVSGPEANAPEPPQPVKSMPSIKDYLANPDLHNSPGRGPTGKMRNFKAMGSAKLVKTIADLEAFGNDPEALAAIKAVAQEKGVAWNEGPSAAKPSVKSYDPKTGPSDAEKAANAETMTGKGRSPSELSALRSNFETMGKASLAQTISDLQGSGDDPEALGLAQEAMRAKSSAKKSSAKGSESSPLMKGGPKPGGGKGPSGMAPLPETLSPNVGGLSIHELPLGATFAMNDGTQYHTHKFVGDPWMIVKPVDGGKAKPLHKMFAPPQVGPKVPGYGDDGGDAAAPSPAAPSVPAAGDDDLASKLAQSVKIAKDAKSSGGKPDFAAAGKAAASAKSAPGGAAAVNAALAAYQAAGGNDPKVIAALKAAG